MVGEVGLEPTKPKTTDLQSVPFAARDIPPCSYNNILVSVVNTYNGTAYWYRSSAKSSTNSCASITLRQQVWRPRRDLNSQPTVSKTAALSS